MQLQKKNKDRSLARGIHDFASDQNRGMSRFRRRKGAFSRNISRRWNQTNLVSWAVASFSRCRRHLRLHGCPKWSRVSRQP